jgi:ABC-type glutathione transport system ATPase component
MRNLSTEPFDTEPTLSLEGVTLTASIGEQRVAALRNLNLSVARGRVLGVVGESGAGKSMPPAACVLQGATC